MEEINQTEPNQPSLGIRDLKIAADLINICTQRGAFRASELSTVGQLYDRLEAFLSVHDAANAPVQSESTEQV